MTTKVTLPAEVAAAIESYVSQHGKDGLLSQMYTPGKWGKTHEALNTIKPLEVAAALINGYEIAKTPEEELRYYYLCRRKASIGSPDSHQAEGVLATLSILGIQIKGVNA